MRHAGIFICFTIRDFPEQYDGAKRLALETYYRCDKQIMATAEFVANLDRERLRKPTKPRDTAEDGEVKLLNFPDQYSEAKNISFAKALAEIKTNSSAIKQGVKCNEYFDTLNVRVTKYKAIEKLDDLITQVVIENMEESQLREMVLASLKKVVSGDEQKIEDFLARY